MLMTSDVGVADESFRKVADMIENRNRDSSDIWSEPDIKQSEDAEEEREATQSAAAALEDQEGIDDPVRMYLREIGKVFLLSAADEKHLARQMEEGQHIEAIRRNVRQIISGRWAMSINRMTRLPTLGKHFIFYRSLFNRERSGISVFLTRHHGEPCNTCE